MSVGAFVGIVVQVPAGHLGDIRVFTAFAAWNSTRLPYLPPHQRSAGEPRLAVLRDWPYVVITALMGLNTLHFFVMELGLALYIPEHTEAPTVMVAVLLIVNTAMVALFQVRLSRRSDSEPAPRRSCADRHGSQRSS